MSASEMHGVLFFWSETGTEGGYWAFQEDPEQFGWSYDRLHVLEDGDRLTIFDKDNPEQIVWEGEISLIIHPTFNEHVFGLRIHSDQRDIDRETWAKRFIEEHPATLVEKHEAAV